MPYSLLDPINIFTSDIVFELLEIFLTSEIIKKISMKELALLFSVLNMDGEEDQLRGHRSRSP